MTDNEIIKALECCSNAEPCANCPCQKQCDETDLAEIALDLINRQKAEIEMLQIKIEGVQEANAILREHIRKAVKEFAERLKEKQQVFIGHDYTCKFIYLSEIDNLVKEMVGAESG